MNSIASTALDGEKLMLSRRRIVSLQEIVDAQPAFSQNSTPAVAVTLTPEAGKKMRRATTTYVGERMALVFRDQVITAPTILGPIDGRLQIDGNMTPHETEALAARLRAYGVSHR